MTVLVCLLAAAGLITATVVHAFLHPDFTEEQYARAKPIMVIRSAEGPLSLAARPTEAEVRRDIDSLLRAAGTETES